MELVEYPSIKHFKETTGNIYKHLKAAGKEDTIEFVGNVKLHGTNFSAVYDVETKSMYYQSRNRVLDKASNFFNFQEVVYGEEGIEKRLIAVSEYLNKIKSFHKIYFFGELIGQEIQKNVALENLPKQFVIFDIAVEEEEGKIEYAEYEHLKNTGFLCKMCNGKLSVITDYEVGSVNINVFNRSNLMDAQNHVAELTAQVEKECPFAKAHGVSGVGEGVVWRSIGVEANKGFGIRFKVKGDEHTNSKVKTLKQVDSDKIEALKGLEEVCEAICTEARFKQGMQYLIENEIPEEKKKNTFLNWVVEDTLKEEMDFIVTKGIPLQNIKAQLYKNAVRYWQFHTK